ncbi:MAG: TolB family protein [Actinomycetota bacterium]
MTDRIDTMLREIERNEPTIGWSDVVEHFPRVRPAPVARRWPTVATAIAVAAASLFVLVATRPYGQGAASGRPNAILFDYRRTIDTNDVAEQRAEVWSVDPDSGGARVLFDVPEAYDDEAVWSPDGSQILLMSFTPEGDGGVFLMDPDDGRLREVLSDFACASVSWFPDGGSVLCGGGPWREGEDGSNEIADDGVWRIDLEKNAATKLLDRPYTDPAASPDGSQIVVVRITHGGAGNNPVSELFIVDADGSDARPLTSGGQGHYGEAAWSPDGSALVASWERVGGVLAYDVYLIDPHDGSRVRLTEWEGWDGSPVWSPDGSRIAFMSDRTADPAERAQWLRMGSGPFEQSIFVMDADGSDERLVFRGQDFAAPTSWGG